VKLIGIIQNLDLVPVVYRVPGALFPLGSVHQLLQCTLGKLSVRVPSNGWAILSQFLQNALINPDEHSRIGLGVLSLVNDTNLAVAKSFLPVEQKAHSFFVNFGTQSGAVHNKAAPSDVSPAGIHLTFSDKGQGPPGTTCLLGPACHEACPRRSDQHESGLNSSSS
jgi:hypothetical protein